MAVTCLRLTIDSESFTPSKSSWGENIINFINLLPVLSCLALHSLPQLRRERFYLCSNITLLKLRELELSRIECAAIALARIFYRHKQTLKEVSLENINLNSNSGDWNWFIKGIRDKLDICSLYMTSCMSQTGVLKSTKGSNLFIAKDKQ